MGQLGIEGASIGYDTQGIATYVRQIQTDLIDRLVQDLLAGVAPIQQATDQVWVGQSANAFKKKFDDDTQVIVKTLQDIKQNMESQFAQVAKNVDEYDAAIAQDISSRQ